LAQLSGITFLSAEGSGEGLGGLGAEPGKVHLVSGEGSAEGLRYLLAGVRFLRFSRSVGRVVVFVGEFGTVQ
jgi:hypothetical protein